jgi:hypothetical protein
MAMKFGASRSQLYDAQQTARAHWLGTLEAWDDTARSQFEETIWIPLDDATSRVIRAIDQLATIFTQIRQDCEFPTG